MATMNPILSNAVSNNAFPVKARVGDEIRRFSLVSSSFSALAGTLCSLFGAASASALTVKYRDDEGDLILVSSDAELEEAIKVSKGNLNLLVSFDGKPSAIITAPVVKAVSPSPADPVPVPVAARAVASAPLDIAAVMPAPVSHIAVPAAPSNGPAPVNKPWKAKRSADAAPPKWATEKRELVQKWRDEKMKLREKISNLRNNSDLDKKQMKQQIVELRNQVKEHKRELLRYPKDNIMIARFVKDVNFPDFSEVAPGSDIVKTWRFRNESNKPWPEGAQLLWVGKKGDSLGCPDSIQIGLPVAPQEEIDISVPLHVPVAPGRYTATFRLASKDGKKFGQRVWTTLNVIGDSSSDEDSSAKSSSESASESSGSQKTCESASKKKERKACVKAVKMEAKAAAKAAKVAEKAALKEEKAVQKEEKKEMKADMKADMKVQRKNEKFQASNEQIAKYALELKALADMGFTNIALNVRLLEKFGNLQMVLTKLLQRQKRIANLPHEGGAPTTA